MAQIVSHQRSPLARPGANLINVLAAFFSPACVLIFSGTFFKSYKKFKHLDFLSGDQK